MNTDSAIFDTEQFPETSFLSNGVVIHAPYSCRSKDMLDAKYESLQFTNYPSQVFRSPKHFSSPTSTTGYYGQYSLDSLTNLPGLVVKLDLNENYNKLLKSYEKELNRRKFQLLVSEEQLKSEFNRLALALSQIQFETGVVEVIKSSSLRFSMILSDDKMLLLSTPVENLRLGDKKNHIIYSFFINKELVASDAMDLYEFVEGFKGYLTSPVV